MNIININKCLLLLLMTFSIGNVHASLVTYTANGSVEFADPGNAYSLNVNDGVSASGTFDNASFSGIGMESFVTSLSFNIGAASFTEADDIGITEIAFQDGVFLGFNFSTDMNVAGPIAFFDSTFDFFNGEDDNLNLITGSWDSASYSVVPVPAALWLFGSGLIGLAGFLKRRHKV